MHVEMLRKVLLAVGITDDFRSVRDLVDAKPPIVVQRARLLQPATVLALLTLRQELCSVYPSSRLTSLHANCVDKHRHPAVCMVRQLLKTHGAQLVPVTRSDGHYVDTGKKRVRREYVICAAAATG